jgi:hypothetical protein
LILTIIAKNKNLKENMKKWISIFSGMLVKRAFDKRGEVSNCIVIKNIVPTIQV